MQFSSEELEPYYILSGIMGTITRRLNTTWDLQARAGNQCLAYQSAVLPSVGQGSGQIAPIAGRTDNVVFYGGGGGCRLGREVRLGFNGD